MNQADYLFLMTDVDCLYDKNPRTHADAKPIEVVEDISSLEVDVSSSGSRLGTGGMSTKLVAARLATSAGVTTIIARSNNPGNITAIVDYIQAKKQAVQTIPRVGSTSIAPLHTRFLPDPDPIRDRPFWLLHGLAAHGTIFIDEGAYRALASKAGLLPSGVVGVEGQFSQQEAVCLVVVDIQGLTDLANGMPTPSKSQAPIEVGRALVNYSANEIRRIKGLQSTEIHRVLGYADSEYVALRQNVSLLKRERPSRPITPVSVVASLQASGSSSTAEI